MIDQRGHLNFLDGIRGVAILSVFLFHALAVSFGSANLPWNGWVRDFHTVPSFIALYPLSYGSAGVAIFFVVSGFCIHLSYQRSKAQGWFKFFHRRFFRIYPPYLAAIYIFFFLWPWGNPQMSDLVPHLFLVHNLDKWTFFGINPSFWSIAVEFQIYAVYPLLIWITFKYGWKRSLLFIGLIELGIRSADSVAGLYFNHRQQIPYFIKFSPLAFGLSWSIGAYLAQCFLDGKRSIFSLLRIDIVALIAFAIPLFKPTEPFMFLAFSLLTGVVIDRFLSEKWKMPTSGLCAGVWRHLGSLGVLSYSFYLLHHPLMLLANRAGYSDPLIKFGVCCLSYVPIFALSNLFYRFIEQPSIALGKRFWISTKSTKNTQPVQPSCVAEP